MGARINIVWLKRDLRTQDHAPLHAAEKAGIPYVVIYIFEPTAIEKDDWSVRHGRFIWQSIEAVNQQLHGKNEVISFYGEATSVFQFLLDQFNVEDVFSYQESGTQSTYDRDLAISKLLNANYITWTQFQRDGIRRGITNRDGWDKQWYATMHQPIIVNSYSVQSVRGVQNHPFVLPVDLQASLAKTDTSFQLGGEHMAWVVLNDFVSGRGVNYRRHISKPGKSHVSCSRLSPFLAWGNISVKQVYQFVRQHEAYKNNKGAYSAFLTRLKWHCHFIQKFEVECRYESEFINRGYTSMPYSFNVDWIKAWEEGKTGYPLVDACMRCLHATGWINFRMRAMLVSFFTHHMDHDWRYGVYHLARLFLDYEPGIHYTQFQMQAGTTGINTVRIYNPVKQSIEHDPTGEFIKKWIPELQNVPKDQIHEPWKLSALEQQLYGLQLGVDYPFPILNHEEAAKQARTKVWRHKASPEVKAEKQRMLETHTRKTNRWA